MRILFCDDDAEVIEQLQGFVSEFFLKYNLDAPEYSAYLSGDALLDGESEACIAKTDIAFLDVEMPGRSGIHVGVKLKEVNPYIKIFIVTSYPDYLDEAMRFRVFRYLSKPIDANRLYRNLHDAVYQISMENVELAVETRDGVVNCRAEEIMCVESKGGQCILRTSCGELLPVEPFEYWEKKLTLPCFYRSFRGVLINLRFVSSFEKERIRLRCREREVTVYLAQRRYTEFKNLYLTFMENAQ